MRDSLLLTYSAKWDVSNINSICSFFTVDNHKKVEFFFSSRYLKISNIYFNSFIKYSQLSDDGMPASIVVSNFSNTDDNQLNCNIKLQCNVCRIQLTSITI